MSIKLKTLEDRRTSALIMLTAKAAEGCHSCLEGYKRVAQNAGATEQEIRFALAAGMRARENVAQAQQADKTQQRDATAILLRGKEKEQFLQRATMHTGVLLLDRYFQSHGYIPVPEAQEVAYYVMGDKICTGAYIPYQLKGDEDRFAWIGYNVSQKGEDLVSVMADLSVLKALPDPTCVAAPEQCIQASYIVEEGQVIAGHACDTNCFWNNLWPTCSGCLVGCLMSGPGWIPCTVTCCGGNATVWCFWCGCC
ncbi:AhpD family alkylhydroperoxidase [Thermosporothrix hazakensis]|jgi:AhpD family alkylhydroperoxidase|uniref:AhpD family alkylhydroperoxidase n=2 Tax=Thermosporothrix hazakensis TaxID=644383 RepID=A0A326TZ23_THEHA|nr:carboxymuconolactone decarboxylase family protein [Thermosporothrix hazakensis]PZW21039.1 AhpD family alkylhydroperoxidase [Thermosporothrix hazakensis]GCE46361.1 hypothetical protein KTH_12300 [Thermosporothrix hazakensis]